jgi:type VI secretion system protein ImpE
LRAQAFEEAPASSGTLNGAPFDWIADADSRLGPMLEAVVNARYYWIPLNHIANLTVEKPEDLRDLVWMPAQFTWINGGQAVGLIPTRYPGSETHADSNVRLARRTEWQDLGHDTYIGFGQRMFTTNVDDFPLMEVRDLSLTDGGGAAPAGVNG